MIATWRSAAAISARRRDEGGRALAAPPADDAVKLDLLNGTHREALRAACAQDPAIGAIYAAFFLIRTSMRI